MWPLAELWIPVVEDSGIKWAAAVKNGGVAAEVEIVLVEDLDVVVGKIVVVVVFNVDWVVVLIVDCEVDGFMLVLGISGKRWGVLSEKKVWIQLLQHL